MEIIHPDVFLATTCVISAIVSVMTGSSWTTIATIGVALMGIGKAQGFAEGWDIAIVGDHGAGIEYLRSETLRPHTLYAYHYRALDIVGNSNIYHCRLKPSGYGNGAYGDVSPGYSVEI